MYDFVLFCLIALRIQPDHLFTFVGLEDWKFRGPEAWKGVKVWRVGIRPQSFQHEAPGALK